ncbi:MAG: VTT domain-containing protein, partial [Candidatus Korobacteraceae bacterium]
VQHATRRATSYMSVLRHLGGVGLFALAVLDSSPFPTFGGTDILTAILAARPSEPWYYYAAMASAGSILGAYITFRMARRAGADYLRAKFGARRVTKLLALFERWGTGALALSTAVPIPSPTSAIFAAAGVLKYPTRKFLVVVTLCRVARYSAIAVIASRYGRHFVRALLHPRQYYGALLLMAVALMVLVMAAILVRKQLEEAREILRTGAEQPSSTASPE